MRISRFKALLSVCLVSILALMVIPVTAQKKKDKDKNKPATTTPAAAPAEKKEGGIQPYDKVITAKAKTDNGLFKVHQIDDKFFYEIPDTLFGRELLNVTRISKTADNIDYGGEEINAQVLRWPKREKKVLLRVVSTIT